MSKTIDNILAYKELDSQVTLLVLSYSKLMNTIKTAFQTPKGIVGEKETSIHKSFNIISNSYECFFIRN